MLKIVESEHFSWVEAVSWVGWPNHKSQEVALQCSLFRMIVDSTIMILLF